VPAETAYVLAAAAEVEVKGEGRRTIGRTRSRIIKRKDKKKKLWASRFGGPPGMEVEMGNLERYAKWRSV
jgi:hypothetical protein